MSGRSTPALSHLNSAFEPEMDSFFDLDQNDYTTPILSPTTTRSQSTVNQRAQSSGSSFASQSQPTMSGPSHQYDAYRQQTGLPAGGLASTFAVNQATGMQYTPSSSGFVMPIDTLNFPLPANDDFDFGNMSDMEFDADSPAADNLPGMFGNGKSQFVNQGNVAGSSSASSSTYTPQVQRMYPGMHSQQAQAKAAAQKQQQELARQQQQQRALEGQRPLPSQKQPVKTDPAVDERISRLLHQMRHDSTTSPTEDYEDDMSLPHIAKMKKEEDDMDEDERLLASEEGKKLSSKERRQLRNKVSARAFRSRRKEYIGQLEGEVAVKAQENNDLRVQNRQLMEENARLTDLTRMLLSSSAFSGFLNELSVNGGSIPSALQKTPAAQQGQPPVQTRKDVNPHQVARQMQQQQQSRGHNARVGMTMIPETSIDFSSLDINNSANGWNSGIDMNTFQVFAVTSVPEPAIDVAAISGKSSDVLPTNSDASKDIPRLPSVSATAMAEPVESKINEDVELDESLTLFIDTPAINAPITPFSTLVSVQKPCQLNLVVCSPEDEAANAVALERLCSIMDESSSRIESLVPGL